MNDEILIKKLNRLITTSFLILLSTLFSIGLMVIIAERTLSEVNSRLTKIDMQLEMFEEAIPGGIEIIYLNEDDEYFINNDMITGNVKDN